MWAGGGNWQWWMRLWSSAVVALIAGATVLLALSTPEERGKDLFERRCSGCHARDTNKEGPRLRGVYGRKAASLADFEYSDALKKRAVRWDDASLDRKSTRLNSSHLGISYAVF